MQAALYGPFASRDAINCDGTPVWKGTVEANGDGEYRTEPFKVTTPGYYTYRESLAASEFVRATETPCLDAAETTVVPAAPQVVTQVSDTRPLDAVRGQQHAVQRAVPKPRDRRRRSGAVHLHRPGDEQVVWTDSHIDVDAILDRHRHRTADWKHHGAPADGALGQWGVRHGDVRRQLRVEPATDSRQRARSSDRYRCGQPDHRRAGREIDLSPALRRAEQVRGRQLARMTAVHRHRVNGIHLEASGAPTPEFTASATSGASIGATMRSIRDGTSRASDFNRRRFASAT